MRGDAIAFDAARVRDRVRRIDRRAGRIEVRAGLVVHVRSVHRQRIHRAERALIREVARCGKGQVVIRLNLVPTVERVIAVDGHHAIVAGDDPAVAGKLVRRDGQIPVAADCAALIGERACSNRDGAAASGVVADPARRIIQRCDVQANCPVAVNRAARIDERRIGTVKRDVVRTRKCRVRVVCKLRNVQRQVMARHELRAVRVRQRARVHGHVAVAANRACARHAARVAIDDGGSANRGPT